jgi:hypothetical protein
MDGVIVKEAGVPDVDRDRLRSIKTFPSLVKYLRDELDWPIEASNFEDLTFEYEAEELGIDPKNAAKIQEIKQLRPLTSRQPWGIFFLKFEPKRLPVVALRRILSQLVVKKRASVRKADQPSWHLDDLLFISNYGEGEERQITFAHFSQAEGKQDLPTLKVLGWDNQDTALHLDDIHLVLKEKLRWPRIENDFASWRERWSSAFILKHREVITTSKELAVCLADLARRIRRRAQQVLAIENDNGPLRKLHKAFQSALIHDLNEDDFSDMYAQTISYGLLAARVSRPLAITADAVREMVPITNPFLREMLGAFLKAGGRKGKLDFDELGVQDVVELLNSPDTHLEAVLHDFGNRTRQEDPVINFYELFLREYDRQKKVERGVFYTPQPVVSYIVRSVHELLQSEFSLEDGLADTTTWGEMAKRNPDIKIPDGLSTDEPFVNILDIAAGTATFLVEAISVIYETMSAKWKGQGMGERERDAKWNIYVPKHLLPRLYGYELMMAPYAIAHMKIGLKLLETGYKFGSDERIRIYLTNSLEPPQDFSDQFEFMAPALAHEAKAVNEIKRNKRFTVVIGNPPYAYESANSGDWISNLLLDYFQVDGKSLEERNPRGLQDDYVKFIRLAQFLIDQCGVGIVGLITNHGFLSNPTFRGMRQSLLLSFDRLSAYDLHGNANRNELAPDGTSDENVFDILQGVSIICARRGLATRESKRLYHADLFGNRQFKCDRLSNATVGTIHWREFDPSTPFYLFVFREMSLEREYNRCPSLTDIFGLSSVGISTSRDNLCVQFTAREIVKTVEEFTSLPVMQAREHFRLGPDVDEWSIALAQNDLKKSKTIQSLVTSVFYRPFDVRYTLYTGNARGFHSRPRSGVMRHMLHGKNLGLCSNRQVNGEFRHVFVTQHITDGNAVSLASRERTYLFPLYLMPITQSSSEFKFDDGERHPNLQQAFLQTVRATLQLCAAKSNLQYDITPEDIFNYVYAVLHSPGYRSRYEEFLKIDFPHLPLSSNLDLFRALACHGEDLVLLHLMESSKLNSHVNRFFGSSGYQVEKVSWSNGTVWVDKNQTTGFAEVPEQVWNFHIGGYQVCEKWLKDRKGRKLSAEDITHYQKIIVALSETIRIMREIDEVIEAHGGWPGAFVTDGGGTSKAVTGIEPENDDVTSYPGGEPAQLPWGEKVAEPALGAKRVESNTEDDNRKDTPANIDDTDREDRIAVIREVFSTAEHVAGIDRESSIREVAKALGFDRLGPRIRECIEGDLIAATRRGVIYTEEGLLHLDCRSIDKYSREQLKQYLQSVMGTTWWDQEDAIRAAVRYLGFRRTGSAIQEAFRSAINGAIRQGLLERDGTMLRVIK